MVMIKVRLKDQIQPFDERTWNVSVLCGEGTQPLRWLAYAACARMAFITGDVPAKFVPQAVRSLDGKVLDADKAINELLQGGAQVEIDFSRGPEAFTVKWDGKPPAKVLWMQALNPIELLKSKTTKEVCAENVSIKEATDLQPAEKHRVWEKNFLRSIAISPLEQQGIVLDKDILQFCGFLQSLLIWYSAQGDELEDKDFAALNLEQFKQIFLDADLLPGYLNEAYITSCFKKAISSKSLLGVYQLSMLDFVIAMLHVAIGFSYESDAEKGTSHEDKPKKLSDNVEHLVRDFLVPSLTTTLGLKLEELHVAGTKSSILEVLKSKRESLQRLLEKCALFDAQHEVEFQVDFKRLLPFFKKWLILGEHWNHSLVALLIIYAFQINMNPMNFVVIPSTMSFGISELQKFMFGASFYSHRNCDSLIKISLEAYLKDFLEKFFVKANVAKPLYSTYEEKKAYLCSILIKHG